MFAPADHFPTADEWIHDWEVQRDFTLAVAEKMPGESYDFKASPEEMTFGQMVVHIAASLGGNVERVSGTKAQITNRQPKTKEDVLKTTHEWFDFSIRGISKLTSEQLAREYQVNWEGRKATTGRQIILAMFAHTAHHRGQLEVYLRLKGIAPPLYTF
jgi:uncharacterized damage-inducible protein DinB